MFQLANPDIIYSGVLKEVNKLILEALSVCALELVKDEGRR